MAMSVSNVAPKLIPFAITTACYFYLFPNRSEPNLQFLIAKTLPIASLCLFIVLNGLKSSYSMKMLFGLLFHMGGDICFFDEKNYFEHGVASFAIGHIFYISAFGFSPLSIPAAIGAALFGGLWHYLAAGPFVGFTYYLSLTYVALILIMLWRAIARLESCKEDCCMKAPSSIGAMLFVASDFLLSIDRFGGGISYANINTIIMILYFAGQAGLALSVAGSPTKKKPNQEEKKKATKKKK